MCRYLKWCDRKCMYLMFDNILFILVCGIYYDDLFFFLLIKNDRVWDCDNDNFFIYWFNCIIYSVENN